MGAFKISEDLPDGWMVYVERGEVLYYSSPEGLRFSTQEDVHDYLTDTDNFLVLGQQLVDGIHKKENEKVSRLLDKMDATNVNESYVTEWSFGLPIFPLQVGCMVNNCSAVEKLLSITGVNVNVENEDGMTPIMNAALSCSRKVLRLMLDHPDVDLDGRNNDGKGLEQLVYESEKHKAVKSKCLEMIKEAKEKLGDSISEQVSVICDVNGDNLTRQERNYISKKVAVVQDDENRNRRIKPKQGSVIPQAKRRRISLDINAEQYPANTSTAPPVNDEEEDLNEEDEDTEDEDDEDDDDTDHDDGPYPPDNFLIKQENDENEVEDIVDNGEDDDESDDDNDNDDDDDEEDDNINGAHTEIRDVLNSEIDVDNSNLVKGQLPHALNAQHGHSLEDVRANIRRQFLDQIDRANIEIGEREQRLNKNMEIREGEKMDLKGKYNSEKFIFDMKLDEKKVKLEQNKFKLEQQLAELQQSLADVRHDLTEIHQKGRQNDENMKKRYKNEKTKIDRKFEKEDEENKQNLSILKEKTKQLTKDLDKMVDVDDNDNNASSNLKEAKEALECPICMEMMKPPTRIWMCPTSHLVCEPCKDQLLEQPCPTCRVQRVTLRAFMAENFARTLFK